MHFWRRSSRVFSHLVHVRVMGWWMTWRISSHLVRWLLFMVLDYLLNYNLLDYHFFDDLLFDVMFFTSLSKAASFRVSTIAGRAAAQYQNH